QNTCTGTHSGSMVSVSKGDGIQLILSTVGLIDPTRAAIGGPQNCRISPSESVTDYGSSVSVGERNATKIACYSTCLRLPCRTVMPAVPTAVPVFVSVKNTELSCSLVTVVVTLVQLFP